MSFFVKVDIIAFCRFVDKAVFHFSTTPQITDSCCQSLMYEIYRTLPNFLGQNDLNLLYINKFSMEHRPAKPRFPSSNLGGTSRVKAPKSLFIKAFGVFLLHERNFALVEQNSILASKLPNFCRILGCFANFVELILHTTPSVKRCIRYIPFLCIRQVSFRFFLFYYAFFIFYSLAFLMST